MLTVSAAGRRRSPNRLAARVESLKVLSLSGEVALAITGFSGVILMFGGRNGGRWRELDYRRFRMLFSSSLTPLALVGLALTLDAFAVERSVMWRVCSLAYVFIAALTSFFILRAATRARSGDPGLRMPRISGLWGEDAVVLLCIVPVMLLQLANAISLHAFWPLLVAVWWSIALGLVVFVSFVFSSIAA